MNKKIVIAGTLLVLGAILVVVVPTLAHPFWDEETEQYYPWWDTNKRARWGEDGEYCPGPYWADPDSEPYTPPEDAPRRGYGCGGMRGYGSAGSRRGPSRWTG